MAARRRFAILVIVGIVAVAATIGAAVDRVPLLDGLLYDLALVPKASLIESRDSQSPVAVIAIDKRSLDSPALSAMPRALMGPVWAQLIEDLAASGAQAVALDLLLSYSGNRFVAGYDRTLLQALARHRERVVLGRSAATLPARPYLAALRMDAGAMGLLELHAEPDGVYRSGSAKIVDREANEYRTLFAATVERAGYGPAPAGVTLAPTMPLDAMPTYSLIDVLTCAREDPDSLARAFAGRMTFVGTTLAEEDRKTGPDRFLRRFVAGKRSRLCAEAGLAEPPDAEISTVPGVYLHASLAASAASGGGAKLIPTSMRMASATALALAGGVIGLWLSPWFAAAMVIFAAVLIWLLQAALLAGQLWLPAALPILLLAAATAVAYVARYLLEDRQRRLIQNAFGRYLSPMVVDGLLASPESLRLGGSTQKVSIMFADLSGFTALSTRVSAEELVDLTNRYLALVVEEVERTGGYVDKFIGDAVMAMWGAPAPDPEHALDATRSALAAVARISHAAEADMAAGRPAFGVKIGIATGPAVVGNVGTQNRYNFTAVGETVNIASRLEGLPGTYECAAIVDPATAAAVESEFVLRELDAVAVKGRPEPLAVHEPVCPKEDLDDATASCVQRYRAALDLYRQRRFADAAEIWRELADDDGPSRAMLRRTEALLANPPPEDWDGVWRLTSK